MELVVLSAAHQRDAAVIGDARAFVEEYGVPGRLQTAQLGILGGAHAAMVGDRTGAVAAFTAGVDLMRRVKPGLSLVMASGLFAALVGSDDPSTAEAVALVREWADDRGYGLLRIQFPELFAAPAERTGTA